MEKMKLGATFLSEEKTNKYLEDIKNDTYCYHFINKNDVNDVVIEDNLLTFKQVMDDQKICLNCKGLINCPKKLNGLIKELEYIDGKVIQTLTPCDFQVVKQRLSDNYLIRDFDDFALDYRLTSDDVDDFRKSIANKMGRLINGKSNTGLFIYGKTGVGKSYLSICLANRQVEQNRSVAYVNARNTISDLRGYVINDKDKFNDIINKMKTAELLIIDDLGNEKITDWSRDAVLYDVLDYRLRNKKNKIIINSNYNLSELKELYKVDNEVRAKRFINLINSICESIELFGVNRFL